MGGNADGVAMVVLTDAEFLLFAMKEKENTLRILDATNNPIAIMIVEKFIWMNAVLILSMDNQLQN